MCLREFLDRSVVIAEVRFWAGTELDFVRLGMLILISREVWRFARHTFYPRFVQLYGRSRRRFRLASIASIVAFRHDHVLHAVKQCIDIVDVAKINVLICSDIIKRSLMFLLVRVAVEDDDMRADPRTGTRERGGREMDIRNRNDFRSNIVHHLAIALICGRALWNNRDDTAAVMQLLEGFLQVLDSRLAASPKRRIHGNTVELVDDIEVLEPRMNYLCIRRVHLCNRRELCRWLYNRALDVFGEPARNSTMPGRRFQCLLTRFETEPFHHLVADRFRRCEVVVAFLRLRSRRALLVSEVE